MQNILGDHFGCVRLCKIEFIIGHNDLTEAKSRNKHKHKIFMIDVRHYAERTYRILATKIAGNVTDRKLIAGEQRNPAIIPVTK